ncbi:MAG: hypothetical protein CMP20_02640 [Rickettsiales bacterium]|nr:hypothetical protein [Rickettsiales bacterium]
MAYEYSEYLLRDTPEWKAPDGVAIIGLGHKKGSGKDATADILENHALSNGVKVLRIAFAYTLKAVVGIMFGLEADQLTTQEGKAAVDPFWDVTPRQMLQWVGTDCFRNVLHPKIWITVLLRRLVAALNPDEDTLVLITDVRFPDEANAIRKWGGVVWRIDRPSVLEAEAEAKAANNPPHVSETALDDYENWDAFIPNDGTLEELRTTVLALIDQA